MVRDHKVMLDMDLAELYGVGTKQLKRAVKRNLLRFPDEFMFELSMEEVANLRCQIGTSSFGGYGGSRYAPIAFTEQGVAMLSSILNSERAILVNFHIIRLFTKMRELLSSHKDNLIKPEQLEHKTALHDEEIKELFDYLKEAFTPQSSIKPIGFTYD